MNYEEILPSSVLHWNYRGLTEFPIKQLQGEESEITDIYLKENLISKLPNDIGMLVHLESLYISGNDITELPKEISNLKHLKCLDVSGNRLKRIPNEIGEVRNLKFLILDENELTELPLRLAELRLLRYLSVCDNKLKWLPQRPIHNYHHCELRFWRNPHLRSLPYSLWYHMFRNQQTRSLNIAILRGTYANLEENICYVCVCQFVVSTLKLVYSNGYWFCGKYDKYEKKIYEISCSPIRENPKLYNCSTNSISPKQFRKLLANNKSNKRLPPRCLKLSNVQRTKGRRCRLKLNQDSKEWDFDVDCPPQCANILEPGVNNPPSLFELSKRLIYKWLSETAKNKSSENYSIFADARKYCFNTENNNLNYLQNDFKDFNIKNGSTENDRIVKNKDYYVPGDIIEEYFNFLPRVVKEDLCNGPVSKCENTKCKKAVFDYVRYEFAIEKLILIDSVQEVIVSAALCSKKCADAWKIGSVKTIPWTFIEE